MKTAVLLLLLSSLAGAADALAEAQAAMASSDAAAKKEALRALASKGAGSDEAVIPLLLAALSDRQAGEAAASVLKSRTGASPKGGVWMIGKEDQAVKAWQEWWKTEQDRRQVDDLAKKAKEAEKAKAAEKEKAKAAEKAKAKVGDAKPSDDKAVEAKTTGEKPAETPTEDAKPVEAKPVKISVNPDDLGRMDRIFLKSGGSMLCYIQSRRTDADGNLLSVRIIHPEGGGEEILPAALISRIDEDIR